MADHVSGGGDGALAHPVPSLDDTHKACVSGTHRVLTPAHTLSRIQPLFPVFGITRLADVTWLDEIGIPVHQAVRPNSRTMSVSQGKGLTHDLARISEPRARQQTQPTFDIHTLSADRMSTHLSERWGTEAGSLELHALDRGMASRDVLMAAARPYYLLSKYNPDLMDLRIGRSKAAGCGR